MGMYTGIRFKGYVKPEFREGFEIVALNGEWENHQDAVIKKFGEIGRSGFIPRGMLCYMPNEWEDENEEATEGFERAYDKETGYWAFQCSLKNYENEIEEWFKIVPRFIERIEHLEYFYEEWDYSEQYDLVDGEVKLINDKFKDYGYID